jgi:uncharacterized protein
VPLVNHLVHGSVSGAVRPPLDGVVLITGASSGIGLVLARMMAPRARALALVARRKDRLDALADELRASKPGLLVHTASCDLADTAQTDAMLALVASAVGPVDVLVNNAGFGDLGVFDRANWDKTRRMIDLNVTALTYLTHRLVGPMVERGRGGILMISSSYGLAFTPGMAAYIGTKHYVTGFTEALRLDLTGTGVVVTQSCPGPVATEFADGVGNFTGMDVPRLVEISAEHCARSSLRAFERGRAMVIPGVIISTLMTMAALTPRWVLRLLYMPVAAALRRKQVAVQAGGR